jgi:diguanylate cyclase (GGDEF)-like protein
MARIAGALYLAGAALVLLSMILPHPPETNEGAIIVLAGLAALGGAGLLLGAGLARLWSIHAAIAAGSALISLSIYFTGEATGVYSTMFVWVVLLSTFFFPGRGAAAQLAFLLLAYGITLGFVDPGPFSAFTRWFLTATALSIACATTSWLVDGLRESALNEEKQRVDAETLARTDELTNLPNRRWLRHELVREMSRADRQGFALWTAVIDLDRFKTFNDRLGHAAGDALLRAAADQWGSALRAGDFLARIGGEEFVVLLADCSADEATRVIERLRAATPLDQTCSVGMARWSAPETPETLVERADQALYRAKAAGRDRVVIDRDTAREEIAVPMTERSGPAASGELAGSSRGDKAP